MRFSRRAHGRESVGGGGSSRSSGAMWGAPNTSEAAARRAARSTPPSRPRGTGGGTGTVATSCRGGWSHRSVRLSGAPCRPRSSHWTAPRAASGEDSFHQQDNFEEVNEVGRLARTVRTHQQSLRISCIRTGRRSFSRVAAGHAASRLCLRRWCPAAPRRPVHLQGGADSPGAAVRNGLATAQVTPDLRAPSCG